jgi:hypothetical protein
MAQLLGVPALIAFCSGLVGYFAAALVSRTAGVVKFGNFTGGTAKQSATRFSPIICCRSKSLRFDSGRHLGAIVLARKELD